MDAILICSSNVIFENFAAFAIFGIVGNLGRWPWNEAGDLGAFTVGFLTLPQAVLSMPGSNFWAVLLFFTLIVLGFSSAFVMLDVVATLLVDSGLKYSRPTIVSFLTLFCFLLCLPYCTEFGYHLLDGIDRYLNSVVLIFVVWAESVSSTSVYRYQDVLAVSGPAAFWVYQLGYLGGQVFGISLAHSIGNPGAGAGAGIGFWAVCSVIASVLSRADEGAVLGAPSFWKKNRYLAKFWYLAFYSVRLFSTTRASTDHQGNQLRRDLNIIVGTGRNWRIPSFLPVLLCYVSGPILAIVFSFAFPDFHLYRYDPLYITGFILSIIGLCIMLAGFIAPRYYEVFIPTSRRVEGTEATVVNETKVEKMVDIQEVESASQDGGDSPGVGRDVEGNKAREGMKRG
jgi:solute carrier family 6 GABA transporter-like protein 1